MARQRRRLGPASIAGIGCSVLFVGCCAWTAMANVFFGMLGASGAAPIASAPPPVIAPPVAAGPPMIAAQSSSQPGVGTPPRGDLVVSQQELGDRWPLTVDHGTLRCRPNGGARVVTFEAPDGRVYAVNGAAATFGAELDPIWAPSPDPSLREIGGRVSLTYFISLGLTLCP